MRALFAARQSPRLQRRVCLRRQLGRQRIEQAFARDLAGRDGSLRTYSSLEQADTKVLHATDNEALVRATLEYATAVGAVLSTRAI